MLGNGSQNEMLGNVCHIATLKNVRHLATSRIFHKKTTLVINHCNAISGNTQQIVESYFTFLTLGNGRHNHVGKCNVGKCLSHSTLGNVRHTVTLRNVHHIVTL
jgi:hypothetical protein